MTAKTSLVQLIAFRLRRSRGEMYIGQARLCICLCVCPRRIPTLLHGPGCNLGNGRSSPRCALLGGFAIGAHVSLLWQHGAERKMSVSACTRCMPGLVYWQVYWSTYRALDLVLVWSVYPDNNLWTKLPLTQIFGKVKFENQGHRPAFTVTRWKYVLFGFGCTLQRELFFGSFVELFALKRSVRPQVRA